MLHLLDANVLIDANRDYYPLMARVIEQGYAKDLNDEEIETIGQDAFLIAYALADVQQRRVVTTETSRPRRKRANRHIPDVCRDLGIRCYNTFEFLRALDFTTRWKAR